MAMFTTTTLHVSIVDVVKVVEAELHDLSTRKRAIRRRIRSIRRVLDGLQQGVGRPVVGNRSAELPLLTVHSRGKARGSADSATPCHNNSRPGFNTGGKSDDADCRLRRACRLALVEIEGAASAIEICSRIVRRGSFSFNNHHYAVAAVVRTLDAMANDGEAHCLNDGLCRCWMRIAKEKTL
jgi:hypothetical protein